MHDRKTMQPLVIGDLTFVDAGPRLWVGLAEELSSTTWSVQGAAMAVGWLLAWIMQQEGQTRAAHGHASLLDKTLREVLTEVSHA